jgi:capsular polysaccharide biosynthesis protein
MVNEDELIPQLLKREFEIVEPQKLGARAQIKLFSSASFILSQSGSALYNTVFCHKGTRLIDIESEPHWGQGHSRLFASRGLKYGIFEGRPKTYDFNVHHLPFHVDVPRLLKRVDEFLS